MAMYRINNGEPVVYKHRCPADRAGKPMTQEEYKDFLAHNLVECYRECGKRAEVLGGQSRKSLFGLLTKAKKDEGMPDVRLYDALGPNSINIDFKITTQSTSAPFAKKMVENYYKTGNLPVLAIASGWCFDNNNKYPINGASFATKFDLVSLLSDENEPLQQKLTQRELVEKVMEGWKTLNADIFAPYLDVQMHYIVDAVFHEMSSKREYLNYIRGKFEALKKSPSHVDMRLCKLQDADEFAILFRQPDKFECTVILRIVCKDGRIIKMMMNEFEE